MHAVLATFALRVQRDIRGCVADLHRHLGGRQDNGGRGHGRGRDLHRRSRRHRRGRGLPDHGAAARLTADVGGRVHRRVDGLPRGDQGLEGGQGAQGGAQVTVHILGPQGKASLPPWDPAQLPGHEEGDAEQGQTARRHHQRQQAHRHIYTPQGGGEMRHEARAVAQDS